MVGKTTTITPAGAPEPMTQYQSNTTVVTSISDGGRPGGGYQTMHGPGNQRGLEAKLQMSEEAGSGGAAGSGSGGGGDPAEEPVKGKFEKWVQPLLAEFIGQIFFVYMICMTSNAENAALAVGLMLFTAINWFAHISGGHFNPAVTFGILLTRQIQPLMAAGYVVAQCMGAIIAGLLYKGSVSADVYDTTAGGAGPLDKIDKDLVPTLGNAVLIEIILTFILVFTVLSVAVDSKGSKSYFTPFCVGISVGLDAMIGGAYTGASMNPARSFGPAVAYMSSEGSRDVWTDHWVFWVGPLCGAALASIIYQLVSAEDDKNILKKLKVA